MGGRLHVFETGGLVGHVCKALLCTVCQVLKEVEPHLIRTLNAL